jgi:uncharacterized linocin/CFP29 family protein
MNGSLGRDRLWNQQIWSDIDKAVQEELGRIRVAQKVFPSTVVKNVLSVSTKRIVPFGAFAPPAGPTPDQFQPFFEISRDFVLTQAEVDGEENVHLATSFARSAASVIADAEDTILFLGPGSILPLLVPAGVNVTNQSPLAIPAQFATIPPGFVAEAAQYPPGTLVGGQDPRARFILTAVRRGIGALTGRFQHGPYALFLSPRRYAQAFEQPRAGLFKTPGDQINHVVTGGFCMVNRLAAAYVGLVFPVPPPAPDIGILVSLGGEPAKIILRNDAMTDFTYTDGQGNYHFRVFEQVQMVVRDGRAFQILRF